MPKNQMLRLAHTAIDHQQSTAFVMGDEFSDSPDGASSFLEVLQDKYTYALRNSVINERYTLTLPKNNAVTLFNSMIKFLETKKPTVFCCSELRISVDSAESIAALIQLLPLLNAVKLDRIIISIQKFSTTDQTKLSETLKTIDYTHVEFPDLPIQQALTLEGINQTALQIAVPYCDGSQVIQKTDEIKKRQSPIAVAKMEALLNDTIRLEPVQGKVGIQNQYHHQQEMQQETEIKILQSWQIDQEKSVSTKEKLNADVMLGDESKTLINWQDIKAAFDNTHPLHEESRKKLGEELLNYDFMGRNLVDLWQRLTGDIEITEQEKVSDDGLFSKSNQRMKYHSEIAPKQISHKALLAITRKSYEFQDGIHIESLPKTFGFSPIEGALFIKHDTMINDEIKQSPYAPEITEQNDEHHLKPNAEFYDVLINSRLTSCIYYHCLAHYIGPYKAWHSWRDLNLMMDTTITNNEMLQSLDSFPFLESYAFSVISQENKNVSRADVRKFFKDFKDKTKNEAGYLGGFNFSKVHEIENIKGYISTLSSILEIHQTKIPNRPIPYLNSNSLEQLSEQIGYMCTAQLIIISASEHTSVVYNLFSTLHDIENKWGHMGLQDFSRNFLIFGRNRAPKRSNIERLLQFSSIEYDWWQQLTRQHSEHSFISNFDDLMEAYSHFLTELDQMGLKDALTMPCPIQGIKNLKVGLNRVIALIRKSKKPLEQMSNLQGLDWSASGVIFAAQKVDYQYISAQMQINAKHEKALSQFRIDIKDPMSHLNHPYQHNVAKPFFYLLFKNANDETKQQHLLQFSLAAFYRFIAARTYAAPQKVYQQLLDTFELPGHYQFTSEQTFVVVHRNNILQPFATVPATHDLIKAQILSIIAYAMSGKRGLNRLPATAQERSLQLRHFIHIVYECARHRGFNEEVNGMLQRGNYVSSEDLRNVLEKCASLFPISNTENFNLDEQYPSLDLEELTLVLTLIRNSVDHPDTIDRKLEAHPVIGRIDNQLIFTQQFLAYFKNYFTDALYRLGKFNPDSNYAAFLIIAHKIKELPFSFENKGRLIRLFGLIALTGSKEIEESIALLHRLATTDALDEKLHDLSRYVPRSDEETLTIARLNQFLDSSQTVETFFIDFRVDFYLDEVNDNDFYQDANTLEKAHIGLGKYYALIKAIVLQQYPVPAGADKIATWDTFLSLIKDIKNSEKQQQLLQTILDAAYQEVDLGTLNRWISAFATTPDIFTSLSPALIHHLENEQYIARIKDWLRNRPHQGFIEILNRLAHIKNAERCLKSLSEISMVLFETASEGYPWHQDLLHLMDKNEDKISLILDNLAKLYQHASMQRNPAQFKQMMLQLLKDRTSRFELIINILQNFDTQNQAVEFNLILILGQLKPEALEKAHSALVQLDEASLAQLAACYQSQPIPNPKLLKKFINKEISVPELIAEHHRNPHADRNAIKLKRQFNNEIFRPFLDKVKSLKKDGKQPLAFKDKLNAQLQFINQIGEDYAQLSIAEIEKLLRQCRANIAKESDSDKKCVLYLQAISLIREAVYKTCQAPAILWPSAIQMLAVLCALNHRLAGLKSPIFLQIATGEGKSLLAVIQSLLLWMDGQAAATVTHRASLAYRDVKIYTPLFESLGIECQHLTADGFRKEKNRPLTGVYYVEFNDLALIRQQKLVNFGEDISNMSFIIDEGDELILHNQTDNNLSQASSPTDTHIHAWVFEALAGYLDNTPAQESLNVTISELVEYLRKKSLTAINACEQTEFLQKLPQYVQAAWYARTLINKEDFLIKPKAKNSPEYYAAVLLNDNYMPANVTFNGLIQQALHGRLNYQAKKDNTAKYFSIAPETTLFSTMNPEAVIEWMSCCGSVIVQSATIGSNAERLEMELNFGFDYYKFPRLQNVVRIDYPEQFCANEQEQMDSIFQICQYYTTERTAAKSRAIIIPVDSIAFAEKLDKYLNQKSKTLETRVFHADLDDVSDKMLSDLEVHTGKSNHILTAVGGLIVRGFDTKLSSATQVVCIDTYIKSEVDEQQRKGRASRVNPNTGLRDKGKYYGIYNLEKELKRYPNFTNSVEDLDINPEAFKQRQYFAHYQQESQLRLHRQLSGSCKNIIQRHFFSLWQGLFRNPKVTQEMRQDVMTAYTIALEAISNIMLSGQSENTLNNYNQKTLDVYKNFLTKVESMIGLESVEKEIEVLRTAIQEAQRKLIDNREKTIALGANKPRYTIHKQWKPNVNYNAYLEQGKQNFVNYAYAALSTWFIPTESRQELLRRKSEMIQKFNEKNDKKSDFMSQLEQVIAGFDNQRLLFNHYISLFNSIKPIPAISVDASVTVTHAPFMGNPSEIRVLGNNRRSFEKLQLVIKDIYKEFNIEIGLKFHIDVIDQIDNRLYQVIIDFSSHDFDNIDRMQLLKKIADKLGAQFLDELHMLPLKSMQEIVAYLKNKLSNAAPDFSNEPNDLTTREHYYTNIFSPLIMYLSANKNNLNQELQTCTSALENYHQNFCYQNRFGEECKSIAPIFENMESLLENHSKNAALAIIAQYIKVLSDDPHKELLLLRQQKESLIQLGIQIATTEDPLSTVYEKWKISTVHIEQQPISMEHLMQKRHTERKLFGMYTSPDLSSGIAQLSMAAQENKTIAFSI